MIDKEAFRNCLSNESGSINWLRISWTQGTTQPLHAEPTKLKRFPKRMGQPYRPQATGRLPMIVSVARIIWGLWGLLGLWGGGGGLWVCGFVSFLLGQHSFCRQSSDMTLVSI